MFSSKENMPQRQDLRSSQHTGESHDMLRPVEEGGGSMGDSSTWKIPAPADPYPPALTVPIYYMEALDPNPHITEFQVYAFCADSMCFSCKTYDILNPPTDEHLCNNKRTEVQIESLAQEN